MRGGVRMFVLERIKMLRVTDEKFTVPEGFRLNDFVRDSFKVMRDELRVVKVRISPEWARWAEEKIWHESQKSRRLDDGSLELGFRVAGLDEIRMWVLSLGPEIEVLEPEELRDRVRDSLEKTLAGYSETRKETVTRVVFRIKLTEVL